MMQAFLERASWKSSRTMRAPSPTYLRSRRTGRGAKERLAGRDDLTRRRDIRTARGVTQQGRLHENENAGQPTDSPSQRRNNALLDQLAPDDADEARVSAVCNGARRERLACAWWPVQQHALQWHSRIGGRNARELGWDRVRDAEAQQEGMAPGGLHSA